MKTLATSRTTRRAAWALGAVLIFAHNAAQACPGCKQNMTPGAGGSAPSLSGASIGFGLSIFFMIFMIAALLGGLCYMTYRSCRVLAARERALSEAEEGMPSDRAGTLQPQSA